MTAVEGFIPASCHGVWNNPRLAQAMEHLALPAWPPDVSAIASPASTRSHLKAATFTPRIPREGAIAASFGVDWYHRVHVLPERIDLGSVASVQMREVEVWNAHMQPQTLDSVAREAAEGMTLTGPASPPTQFGALESRLYSLSVAPNGPPQVEAQFRFLFSSDTPTLGVTGRRIVGWTLSPDWSEPVIERLEWLTDVMRSHSGVEQRVRVRAHPRRMLEYRVLAGVDRPRVMMENLLISWQARVYGLPWWIDASVSSTPIAAGVQTLSVDTLHRDYAVGGLLTLVHDLRAEFAEIAAVEPNQLHLKRPLEQSWPAGTRIAPVHSARVGSSQNLSYVTDAIVAAKTQFRLEEECALIAMTEEPDYLGYPVLRVPPNWRDDLDASIMRDLRELDYLTGRRVVDDLTGVDRRRRVHRWLLAGRPAIADFRRWLAARAGRLKPFWLPSFQSDIAVVAPFGAQGAAWTIDNRGYAAGPAAWAGRRDLLIQTVSGERFYRRITGASEVDAQRELIALDQPLGVSLSPADIARISFMTLMRLDADAVEISHHTDALAEVSLPLMSLRDDL
ncbi:hypothetical protein O5O45_31670 [Hahella aquimaris]|uniref:hypothetical protein n=1 Tax=Hahella sp. HNIBRBA332 TaxID=3015983 RepID=UPI00273AFED6|nr:hypothetical protein [Hahella sp. HNIBRBA332]WLQ14279.1 hypothetical protein O5O45_31670 [Hahella sp. HNIBRBA332]